MTDRNTAKKKRAAQNKAAREALAARRARAAAGEAARPAEPTPDRPAGKASARPPAGGGSGTGRPARSAPTTPVAEPTSRFGRFMADTKSVPGGQAVLFAFVISVVAAVALLFFPLVRVEVLGYVRCSVAGATAPADQGDTTTTTEATPTTEGGDDEAASDPTCDDLDPVIDSKSLLDIAGPVGLVLVAVPVGITATALASTNRRTRRRTVTISAFSLGLYLFLMAAVGVFFFVSLGALVWAAWQIRKVEGPPQPRPRTRGRAAQAEDSGPED